MTRLPLGWGLNNWGPTVRILSCFMQQHRFLLQSKKQETSKKSGNFRFSFRTANFTTHEAAVICRTWDLFLAEHGNP